MERLGQRIYKNLKTFLRPQIYHQNVSAYFSKSLTNDVIKNRLKLVDLQHRKVISIEGKDASIFLQGLVTNDVTLLPEMRCMYAMILNQHGRVVHDVMLHHFSSHDTSVQRIFMDCESSSVEALVKMLKLYKLRKKVTISEQNVKVIQALNSNPRDDLSSTYDGILGSGVDPRAPFHLGHRLLFEDVPQSITVENASFYHEVRLENGIPEGQLDLPPGNCLPLESNLDYMNGVSFHKGCYIGQELTARTKFTGVIRKRLMPITIKGNGNLEPGGSIFNGKGKRAGKVRSLYHDLSKGLALVRLSYINEMLFSENQECSIHCHVPSWWPSKDGTDFSDGVCGPSSNND